VIACIIEFGVKPGMEARHQELLAGLMPEAEAFSGFISKETFDSRNNPGKLITVSYWKDKEALDGWMRHAPHRKAIVEGKTKVFSHYSILVADVTKDLRWRSDQK
jgi:heme-degrading monooxygenase HmoA